MPNFDHALRSKLPNVGTTIFTVMSQLAHEHDAINLSQGFPNFPVSPQLINLVDRYMKQGYNQYAPMQGVPELRKVICHKVQSLYNATYDWQNDITITAGATQAIYTAISALVHEEDEVIIFTPAYDCYAPAIVLNGGKPVYIPLTAPDYSIPWDEVHKRLNRKTRMVIINSPHNPTGATLKKKDLITLAKMLEGSETIVLSDEVYEHIIFDGKKHESCAGFPGLEDRSLIIASFGKTFHATGWKMGYILGPPQLMEEFRKVHQFNVFTCNTPVQYALAEYISDPANYLYLGEFYQHKRDVFLEAIQGSRFEVVPSEGTYFQLLGYQNITKDKDTTVAKHWTIEHKVASIPVSVFYAQGQDHHVLRFCFAKDEATLQRAGEILKCI